VNSTAVVAVKDAKWEISSPQMKIYENLKEKGKFKAKKVGSDNEKSRHIFFRGMLIYFIASHENVMKIL
jgi:hypothetical protein